MICMIHIARQVDLHRRNFNRIMMRSFVELFLFCLYIFGATLPACDSAQQRVKSG